MLAQLVVRALTETDWIGDITVRIYRNNSAAHI